MECGLESSLGGALAIQSRFLTAHRVHTLANICFFSTDIDRLSSSLSQAYYLSLRLQQCSLAPFQSSSQGSHQMHSMTTTHKPHHYLKPDLPWAFDSVSSDHHPSYPKALSSCFCFYGFISPLIVVFLMSFV